MSGSKKKLIWLCIPIGIVLIAFYTFAASDFITTTDDGKKVLCKSDGTWRFASQSDLMATKLLGGPSMPSAPNSIDPLSTATDPLTGRPVPAGVAQGYSGAAIPTSSLINVVKGDNSFDFRKIKWGATSSQIKTSETAKLVNETAQSLEYKTTMETIECKVIYEMTAGMCNKASYIISQDYADPEAFYADFERLTGFMSKIYANPKQRDYDWKNEMYKQDRNKWGFAISIGFLSCHVIWQTAKTKIELSINGGMHKFNTAIVYSKL